MIICPICNTELKITSESYVCNLCNYIALKESGVIKFHPNIISDHVDYNADSLDSLYEFENKHFWFYHRKINILKVFQQFIRKEERIIEIGAGTGNVSQMFLTNEYKNIAVGEMHLSGLNYAKKYGLSELFQFDLLKTPFKEHFDVVCMFDVLEHIDDDNLAVQNVNKMLITGGKLVLTVPAHKWLWSNIDLNSGHKRRYKYSTLKVLLEKNNFDVIYFRSFFILLLPLLVFRAITNKKNIKLDNENLERNAGMIINPIMNSALKFICKIENILFSSLSLKFGGSLLMIAKRK